ncbi:MAG: mechanosensitive ion channel [Chloroflexi bacterium]|nr:mechanosensitive ion channel [Chloroflexota bacterium]
MGVVDRLVISALAKTESLVGLPIDVELRLLKTLALVLGLWLLRRIIVVLAEWRTQDMRLRYRWRVSTAYVLGAIGLVWIVRLWTDGLQSLATFLGLLSAGFTVALREPVTNLAGWAFILWRRPFDVGDRIQVGEHAGDVVAVRLFMFTMLEIENWVQADQSTGRIIHVPNGLVFQQPVANYTRGLAYIWNEIPVHVTFESDWQKAKSILQTIAQRHDAELSQEAKERLERERSPFLIMYHAFTPIVYARVDPQWSGVELTVRYLCEPRRRRSTEAQIWEDILNAFASEPDVEFAYPTQRIYGRWIEGVQPATGNPEGGMGGTNPSLRKAPGASNQSP